MNRLAWVFVALATFVIGGCVDDSPEPPKSGAEPIGVQMMRAVPDLRGQHYNNLLDFELPTDLVFLEASRTQIALDGSRRHTGQSCLKLSAPGALKVRLSAVMGEKLFPAGNTLAGAYFFSESPAQVIVAYESEGLTQASSTIDLPAGQWAAALVDLSAISNSAPLDKSSALKFSFRGGGSIWCDDVLLIDNSGWIFGDEEDKRAGKWTVSRTGFSYVCDMPNTFTTRLTSADASAGGWTIEQSNAFRACFTSNGSAKRLTIYSDGRSYWDGEFKPLAANLRGEPLYAQQQTSPAQIQIEETMGRLERRSPGDRDNDGYNESLGAYMILASGPRLEFTIVPRSVPVYRPVFQIGKLPAGKPLVTIEGRLVESVLRLDDGTLLVEIPGKIDRATVINVRVQGEAQ